jgi:hypothetical protein
MDTVTRATTIACSWWITTGDICRRVGMGTSMGVVSFVGRLGHGTWVNIGRLRVRLETRGLWTEMGFREHAARRAVFIDDGNDGFDGERGAGSDRVELINHSLDYWSTFWSFAPGKGYLCAEIRAVIVALQHLWFGPGPSPVTWTGDEPKTQNLESIRKLAVPSYKTEIK